MNLPSQPDNIMEKNLAKATGFQSRAADTTFLFVPVLKKIAKVAGSP
jgi:hypothetical protein